ncbi:peptidase [Glaesserella sp.]|uniref:peptidase n=1 Tax=Glaesserella sp. TaxID=2094731 RepID=UPI00359FBDFB
MLFLLSLFCAYWFKSELHHFPIRLNTQIYDDYRQVYSTDIPLNDFIHSSKLQPKPNQSAYCFFILFPSVVFYFDNSSPTLIFIGILLIYLSMLDYFYYLTDVRYLGMLFISAIAQLLFYEPWLLSVHLLSLFLTSLFFILLTVLMKYWLTTEMLGTGDMLLFIALSPLFAPEQMILLLLYANLAGLAFACGYFCLKRRRIEKLPFIPFITFSTFMLFIDRI